MAANELGPAGQYLFERITGAAIEGVLDQAYDEEAEAEATGRWVVWTHMGGGRVLGNGAEVMVGNLLFLVKAHAKAEDASLVDLAGVMDLVEAAIVTDGPVVVGDFTVECWADAQGPWQSKGVEKDVSYVARGAHYRVWVEPL